LRRIPATLSNTRHFHRLTHPRRDRGGEEAMIALVLTVSINLVAGAGDDDLIRKVASRLKLVVLLCL
jgi:hypothetical protein